MPYALRSSTTNRASQTNTASANASDQLLQAAGVKKKRAANKKKKLGKAMAKKAVPQARDDREAEDEDIGDNIIVLPRGGAAAARYERAGSTLPLRTNMDNEDQLGAATEGDEDDEIVVRPRGAAMAVMAEARQEEAESPSALPSDMDTNKDEQRDADMDEDEDEEIVGTIRGAALAATVEAFQDQVPSPSPFDMDMDMDMDEEDPMAAVAEAARERNPTPEAASAAVPASPPPPARTPRSHRELTECGVCFEPRGTTAMAEEVCLRCNFTVHSLCQSRALDADHFFGRMPRCLNCIEPWIGSRPVVALE